MLYIRFMVAGIACLGLLTEPCALAQSQSPTADQVLQKYIAALGGEEKLKSVTTMKLVETEFGQVSDDKHPTETKRSRCVYLWSNQRWKKELSAGTSYAFDGTNYWERAGKKIQQRRAAATRYPFDFRDPVSYPLHLLDFPGTIEYMDEIEEGERTFYRLKVEPSRPEPRDMVRMTPRELIFDAQTGLLAKILHESKTIEFLDYREVDGIQVAHQKKSVHQVADIRARFLIKVESIEFNVEIDDAELSLNARR